LLQDELLALAQEGVQTLLLEGGPTLAASFFAADLVDKLLVFVAPTLAGEGPGVVSALPEPVALTRLRAEQVGEDVLLETYVHDP
jgi:diaminohydroxyphosphoribosylaminopyrimidine deaminase/5-amino-6-(5-phosphoribosylamino)uracil reductase